MDAYYYSALDLATIISSQNLCCQEESRMIDMIWEGENKLLDSKYQNDKKRFILDVYYWMHYFYEKPILDREFFVIQKDFEQSNCTVQVQQYMSDYSDLDLFFKNIRIRILYGKGNNYVKIKLRSLLKQYGYKRRSPLLLQHINECLRFYHLKVTLRGGVPCNIEEVGLDQMLIFRVI